MPRTVRPRLETLEGRTNPAPFTLPDGSTTYAPTPEQLGGDTAGDPIPGTFASPIEAGSGYTFSSWSAAQLAGLRLTSSNTLPLFGSEGLSFGPNTNIRDPSPVQNPDGTVARINGQYVLIAHGDLKDDTDEELNFFYYLTSPDGSNWTPGGVLLDSNTSGVTGDEMFAGSARFDAGTNRLQLLYTPVFEDVESPSGTQPVQNMALATFTPRLDGGALRFDLIGTTEPFFEPDGTWYVRPEDANTETEVYAFRDPFVFDDPETGRTYMIFAANWGEQTSGVGSTGDAQFPDAGPNDVDPTLPRNDAVIGLAVATDDSLANWQLLPPIFGGVGVNEQLELPHVVYQDGLYYLFTSTHNRTFIGDLKYDYPEGLYGFWAESLQGPYYPLNGDSLVLANPPEDQTQDYAWKVVPTGDGTAAVFSFLVDSGTMAPVVTLNIDGDRTALVGVEPVAGGTPVPAGGGGPVSVVGAGVGGPPLVVVYGPDGETLRSFLAYEATFTGGVRVALGDVTGDGVQDVITGTGKGGGPRVRVFDGVTGDVVREFFPYESTFRGGVLVAAADTDGDGRAEIVTGTGVGGGPRVQLFSGADGKTLANFFAYAQDFRGGVEVAAGDLDGDGRAEIVAGSGPGGGPDVRTFRADGTTLGNFLAFDGSRRGGVTVAVADLTGDAAGEIVAGSGVNGTPLVRVFSLGKADPIGEFLAFPADFTGGVRVGAGDADGAGRDEILAASGAGRPASLRAFDAATFRQVGEEVLPFGDSLTGGLFVG